MIVHPDKAVFFVATAVMCSVSLYAAQLSTAEPDPMARVFVGEPHRLTLPPGFPVVEAAGEEGCPANVAIDTPVASAKIAASARDNDCDRGPVADTVPIPGGLSAASAKAEIPAQSISLGSTDRIH
jgi:hypothetical protein